MPKNNTNNDDLITKQDASPNDNKELRIDKKFVLSLLSFVVTILGAVPAISHFYYAARAGEYYGIPGLYFRDIAFSDFGTLVILVIGAILICFLPFILKTILEGIFDSKVLDLLLKLLFSISLGLVAYMYVIFCSTTIMNGQGSCQVNGNICIGAACYGGLVAFVCYTILVEDFTGSSARSKNGLSRGLFYSKRKKIFKETIYALYSIIFTAALIFLLFTGIKVSPLNPASGRNYEILLDKKSEYSVVVGNYNGSAVLMEGVVSGDNLKLKKGSFYIESIKNRPIEYRHFGKVTVVDNIE